MLSLDELKSKHEDLKKLDEDCMVHYTSLMTAFLRAAETQRDDAIINDPYAEALAGDAGVAMFAHFSKWAPSYTSQMSDFLAIRTRFIDDAIRDRHPSIHQVVLLGAGMDTRAYRLEALADCVVFEVDASHELLVRKRRILNEETNAQVQAKELHCVIADLAQDDWSIELERLRFDKQQPTLWVLEGLVCYLAKDAVIRVLKSIDALSAKHSQLWADWCAWATLKRLREREPRDDGESLWEKKALKFGEDDPQQGVLTLLHWPVFVNADLGRPGNFFGRAWTPIPITTPHFSLAGLPQDLQPTKETNDTDDVMRFFFVSATKTTAEPTFGPEP
ncbi:hypothetical protein PINS_up011010 [Pythium insidiosum]|nr:hypothetical protein PINS_up011010 [Pythium insidiosum]